MCWPQKYPLTVLKSVLAFSLSVAWGFASAGSYTDLQQKFKHTTSDAEVISIIKASGTTRGQDEFKQGLKDIQEGDATQEEVAKRFRGMVDLGALAENKGSAVVASQTDAAQVKASPLYQDPGIDQKRNWLADALRRLKKIKFKEPKEQQGGSGAGFFGSWLVFLMWGVLAAAVGLLLYVAATHIKWQKSLTRKAKALLEEDEPDRTVDEWLQLADDHAAAGRFREAVRALYLACLLRFDENDVARFERGQTNWEHLARIEISPKLPPGVEFRTPTQRFDRIWYGYQTEGQPDVDLFRSWYQNITSVLTAAKA
jgi:hypothetical protein